MSKEFIKQFTDFALEVHKTARDSGFWDGVDKTKPEVFGSKIALIHSELSEALEGFRAGNPPAKNIPDASYADRYSNVEEELADAVIRIMDFSIAMGYDVAGAIVAKNSFNKSRKYKHGKVI